MRRKIYQDLLLWKEKRSQKEALLIDGARRVGKSWIVEEFAKNEYESYIMIDFLVPKVILSNRHNIHPIEVKSTTRYTLTSLKRFAQKYSSAIAEPIVLHTADFKVEDGIVYLPLYMAALL